MEYKEIWMEVIGYEGLYQISNLGRLKSLKRKKTRILALCKAKCGYYNTILINDVKKNKLVHRLICEAFIPNPLNKKEVNHINGIKTDNRVYNLEWTTKSENTKHAYKNGLMCLKGEKHHNSKLTEIEAKEIKYGNIGLNQRQIAKKYGVCFQLISSIKLGRTWIHI